MIKLCITLLTALLYLIYNIMPNSKVCECMTEKIIKNIFTYYYVNYNLNLS